MSALFFNPFKSRDKYFLACKIATLLFCIPWPLTIVASVMSLAGEFGADTPMFLRVLFRLGWLLALVYPIVFFAGTTFCGENPGSQVLPSRGGCRHLTCRLQRVGSC